jgi:hypothetical protein
MDPKNEKMEIFAHYATSRLFAQAIPGQALILRQLLTAPLTNRGQATKLPPNSIFNVEVEHANV